MVEKSAKQLYGNGFFCSFSSIFFSKASCSSVPALSYTILLEGVLAEKKCRQKHGGFWPEMTPLPWLLVPPAHANTTDQAQFEPATVQTTPLVLAKIFIEFWSFCSKFQLF